MKTAAVNPCWFCKDHLTEKKLTIVLHRKHGYVHLSWVDEKGNRCSGGTFVPESSISASIPVCKECIHSEDYLNLEKVLDYPEISSYISDHRWVSTDPTYKISHLSDAKWFKLLCKKYDPSLYSNVIEDPIDAILDTINADTSKSSSKLSVGCIVWLLFIVLVVIYLLSK